MKQFLILLTCISSFFIPVSTKAQVPPIKETYVDLVISDFRATSVTAQRTDFTCTVTNIGDKTASISPGQVALQAEYYTTIDGAQKKSGGPVAGYSVPNGTISPGQSKTFSFGGSGNFTSAKLFGLHMDTFNRIVESNKQNNFRITPAP